VIDQWLRQKTPPGSWVLDPFCSTPLTSLQAAQAGYRVLVTSNNPILAFELEMLCQTPEKSEFQAALAELASTRRGETRLETMLQSYYLTQCATCGREIQAEAFIWKRGEHSPYARIYHCPHCGDEGIHPAVEADTNRLAPILRSEPLHRARALEKATLPEMDADERKNVEEALKVYPVRALVVIVNLLNKLDAYPHHSVNRRLLQALLLPVLDSGTSLWSYPETSDTPHLLQSPAEFIEKNLWRELESAIDLWLQASSPNKLNLWPDRIQEPGIILFPGRAKEFAKPEELEFSAAVCNLPRTNQAFWTLSALWSAWLWGKEISARYAGVLGRRRFDWHWHARALQSPLEAVNRLTDEGTPVLGLVSGAVPGFVLSSAAAASAAGLKNTGAVCKPDRLEIQYHWESSKQKPIAGRENPQNIMRVAIRQTLMSAGQPVKYLAPYASAVNALGELRLLPAVDDPLFPEKLGEIQNGISKIFLDRTFIHHYESAAQDVELGQWYLENPANCETPLDDRVERVIVNLLLRESTLTVSEIQQEIASTLGGMIAPADSLLQACLASYAEVDTTNGSWRIKPGESPAARRADLAKMQGFLTEIAARIGLVAEGYQPMVWKSATNQQIQYRFFLGASAIIDEYLADQPEENIESVYVFPGSRAALMQYKLDHNPRLRELTRQGWHFLKFRYLMALAQRTELNLELWHLLLDGDPLSADRDTQFEHLPLKQKGGGPPFYRRLSDLFEIYQYQVFIAC